mmetsp:Transcript_113149/g.365549  ORF Transcript_113149/g.365549 Transcript_113149/m.365549 type:complete len:343 (-) Transcript_113149:63-1091(-)
MRLGGREPPPQPPRQRRLAGDAAELLGLPEERLPLAVALFFGIAAVVMVAWGFASVEVSEYALNYSLVTRKVEPRTYSPGRYWIGPANYFIKFPSVLTTIQFSDLQYQFDLSPTEQGEAELRSRTRDGLDVLIEISFQYQLMPDKLYELYTVLGGYPEYHNTYVRLAIDRLTESATVFSATEFFSERTRIGKEMERLLRKDFEKQLYSNIFSFQLRSVGLPRQFEDAIQETEVKKQDLQVASAEQNSTRVALETQLMQAKRRMRIMENRGEAAAETLMLSNGADIAQFATSQRKAADSYKRILQELGSKEEDLFAYMEARVLRDHPGQRTVVGLEMPAVTKG